MASLSLAGGDHWILTSVSSLGFARMDPIISPGAVGGHVHHIFGGSNFGQTISDYQQTQDGACSSTTIGGDKSNYWAPLLYYQYPNGTLAPMQGGARIYYYTKNDNITAFPEGLKMITGTSQTRNVTATPSLGLALSCDEGVQTSYLPNRTSHPGGCGNAQLGIYFPSCGTGALDSPDHFSHMAWPQKPINQQGGMADDPNNQWCPESHPIKYPTIFLQVTYYFNEQQPWRGDADDWLVLANGDTTGLAYHADFYNGWDSTLLSKTIEECGYGNGPGDNIVSCAPLAAELVDNTQCRYQGQIPSEEVGVWRPLDDLPGCNKIWTGDVSDDKPACTGAPDPEFVSPNAFWYGLADKQKIPIAFPYANGSEIDHDYNDFIPALGTPGNSKIYQWGNATGDEDAENLESIQIGTSEEVLAAQAGGSAITSVASTASTLLNEAAFATGGAASLSSATTSSTQPTSSVISLCKHSARELVNAKRELTSLKHELERVKRDHDEEKRALRDEITHRSARRSRRDGLGQH